MADDDRTARIAKLEECMDGFDAMSDDPKVFAKYMETWKGLKTEDLSPGSSEWVAVVIDAEQRSDSFKWACQQQAQQRGQAFVRERDWAEKKAAEGLTPGSYEWALAVGKAGAESTQAYRAAELQMATARDAANKKRAALLDVLFADSSSAALATSTSTDAALDILFNSGYDVEGGGGGSLLTQDEMSRMRGIITSTSAALKRNPQDVSLLLRRAALLVALGQAALAREDYERVLQIDPTNPEAKKYVEISSYGSGFKAYDILGVSRNADAEVISVAFRRLAKQWHPDRWVSASESEQLEAETRFTSLNLAREVLLDEAKRRKYDAGSSSVADLVVGWWDRLWGSKAAAKGTKARAAPGLQRTASMLTPASRQPTEVLTFRLTGCGSGVGVGLDKTNAVDMLVPGKPASQHLQMGDRVVEFDGQAMVEQRAGRVVQRMLKDVVKNAETHVVKVERTRKLGLPAGGK